MVAADDKLGEHGELLCCKAECFLCDVIAYAFNFDKYAARCNRSDESFGVTFTFTHSDIGRLAGDRLVGEYANPDLALTLHVTRDGHTGSFYLTAGNPFGIKSLDAERPESKLVAALGIAFLTALL